MSEQDSNSWKDRIIGCLMCLLMVTPGVMFAAVQLYSAFIGIKVLLGWIEIEYQIGWIGLIIVSILCVFSYPISISIGTYICCVYVWEWPWYFTFLFTLPASGILLLVGFSVFLWPIALLSSIFSRRKINEVASQHGEAHDEGQRTPNAE